VLSACVRQVFAAPPAPSAALAGHVLEAVGACLGGPPVIAAPGSSFAASLGAEDTVLLQRGAGLRSGELAAVHGADGLVLRRVFFEGRSVRLESEDTLAPPVFVDRSSLRVYGKVVAIARPGTDRMTSPAAGAV
jgi:hypothetical protein